MSVSERSEEAFPSGFGRLGDPQAQSYEVQVFGRDCLLSDPIRLPQCEVTPGPDLYPEAEDRLLLQEMKRSNFYPNLLTPEEAKKFSAPTVRVYFPRLLAYDHVDAAVIAEEAAQEVLDVIAMHRGAHPTVVGSLIRPFGGTTIQRFLPTYAYRGNLTGGLATEEDSAAINRDLERVRTDPSLRLQVQLYRDARRERDPRMSYFRYWGFLETVAWARSLNDAVLVNWDGNSSGGKPGKVEKVLGDPRKLVFELVRIVVGPGTGHLWSTSSESFVKDRISVWYRKRNCIAHGGFCLCYRGAGQRHSSADYELCYGAYKAALQTTVDLVMADLERVAEAVLRYQFATP